MRPARAFTLVEVLISIVLILVPLLALISAQIYLSKAGAKDEMRVTAAHLAASRLGSIEQQLRTSFAASQAANRAPHASHPDFEIEVQEALTRPDLKRIEVFVYWDDPNGAQSYSAWTYFVDNP